MIWDVNHFDEDDYQDQIEAEDDNVYLEAVEGMSCEEEAPGVSDAS